VSEIVLAEFAAGPKILTIDAAGSDLKVFAGASDLLGKTKIFFVDLFAAPATKTPSPESFTGWLRPVTKSWILPRAIKAPSTASCASANWRS
jgi:hypothetical protein